jgi:hypothetical protein
MKRTTDNVESQGDQIGRAALSALTGDAGSATSMATYERRAEAALSGAAKTGMLSNTIDSAAGESLKTALTVNRDSARLFDNVKHMRHEVAGGVRENMTAAETNGVIQAARLFGSEATLAKVDAMLSSRVSASIEAAVNAITSSPDMDSEVASIAEGMNGWAELVSLSSKDSLPNTMTALTSQTRKLINSVQDKVQGEGWNQWLRQQSTRLADIIKSAGDPDRVLTNDDLSLITTCALTNECAEASLMSAVLESVAERAVVQNSNGNSSDLRAYVQQLSGRTKDRVLQDYADGLGGKGKPFEPTTISIKNLGALHALSDPDTVTSHVTRVSGDDTISASMSALYEMKVATLHGNNPVAALSGARSAVHALVAQFRPPPPTAAMIEASSGVIGNVLPAPPTGETTAMPPPPPPGADAQGAEVVMTPPPPPPGADAQGSAEVAMPPLPPDVRPTLKLDTVIAALKAKTLSPDNAKLLFKDLEVKLTKEGRVPIMGNVNIMKAGLDATQHADNQALVDIAITLVAMDFPDIPKNYQKGLSAQGIELLEQISSHNTHGKRFHQQDNVLALTQKTKTLAKKAKVIEVESLVDAVQQVAVGAASVADVLAAVDTQLPPPSDKSLERIVQEITAVHNEKSLNQPLPEAHAKVVLTAMRYWANPKVRMVVLGIAVAAFSAAIVAASVTTCAAMAVATPFQLVAMANAAPVTAAICSVGGPAAYLGTTVAAPTAVAMMATAALAGYTSTLQQLLPQRRPPPHHLLPQRRPPPHQLLSQRRPPLLPPHRLSPHRLSPHRLSPHQHLLQWHKLLPHQLSPQRQQAVTSPRQRHQRRTPATRSWTAP